MVFKITEKDLCTLGKALQKALLHTDYNSECFSCSDIRRADAFNHDICRVFRILCDNSINIVKDMGKEFGEQFKDYYSESDFAKIETPEKFEVLLYSDAIWRISEELLNLKHSTEKFLRIKTEHFTKYWTAITHGCIYDIVPTKSALLEFSNISYSLKRVLHFVLPEIENCEIKSIKAVNFDENELELEIQYIKESDIYNLYVYENPYRADILISLNGVPLRIYPTARCNQVSLMFNDSNFCNYYEKIQLEKDRLEKIAENVLSKKLEDIDKDPSKFNNLDSISLDGQIYSYWSDSKQLDSLGSLLETLDESSIDYSDVESDIDYLSDICSTAKYDIEKIIFKSIASEYFLDSLEKATRQYHYMIAENGIVKENDYIDYIFNILNKDYKIDVA